MRPIHTALRLTLAIFSITGLALAEEDAGYPPPEREVYVAPDGKPDADGTKAAPLDFETAFTDGQATRPGTLVWVTGGRYEVGLLKQGEGIRGTPGKPVVFRGVPGQRATVVGSLEVRGDHTWVWGVEITWPGGSGCGVEVRGGDGVHLVNNVIHDIGPTENPDIASRASSAGTLATATSTTATSFITPSGPTAFTRRTPPSTR